MRWTALGVDYEMSGKDLIDSVKASGAICKARWAARRRKASTTSSSWTKTTRRSPSPRAMASPWRTGCGTARPRALSYYMFQNPKSAKKLYFDVCSKASDEYLQQLDAFDRQEPAKQLDNPVWHIHGGGRPSRARPVSFSLMLNLVSAADASTKEILWGFLSRYIPESLTGKPAAAGPPGGLRDQLLRGLREALEGVPRSTDQERAAMLDLLAKLKTMPAGTQDAELIRRGVRGRQDPRL